MTSVGSKNTVITFLTKHCVWSSTGRMHGSDHNKVDKQG